jgi:hypothetical protein
MIGHFLWILFMWPNGIVLGNLLASVLWALPVLLHLDRLLRRHHRERLEQGERHHRERLAAGMTPDA